MSLWELMFAVRSWIFQAIMC